MRAADRRRQGALLPQCPQARPARPPAGAALQGDLGRPWEPGAQTELATRIVTTAWRARRADRLEAALLGRYLGADALDAGDPQEGLGSGLIRDGYGPRALETLVRYCGPVPAELFRALDALKVLQADAREPPARPAPDAAPTILPPSRA